MPAFNGSGLIAANIPATQVAGGDTLALWGVISATGVAGESPTPGSSGVNSIVAAVADSGAFPRGPISFQISFATAATDVLVIYGSNTAPTAAGPQNGVALYTSTNKQSDSYIDTSGFVFYWAQLQSQSGGGAFSVIMHIG